MPARLSRPVFRGAITSAPRLLRGRLSSPGAGAAASQTASFVTLARALAHDGLTTIPGFADPVARALLSPGWALASRLLSRRIRRARPAPRERAIAQLDVIPLRVVAIDAELEAAIAQGCRQVVILGAGLDTRAFRMASLADVSVFEVDLASSEGDKETSPVV